MLLAVMIVILVIGIVVDTAVLRPARAVDPPPLRPRPGVARPTLASVALRYDERPDDDTPVSTDDLPADAHPRSQHPGDGVAGGAGVAAGASATTCRDAPVAAVQAADPRVAPVAGRPGRGGDARYWAARADALDDPVTFRLFPDGNGDGRGPDGSHHTRFRTWKESLLGRS